MTRFRMLGIAVLAVGILAISSLNQAIAEEQPATTQPAKVDPVDYNKLKELMPDKVIGIDRSTNEGEKQELNEWRMSRARAEYMKPDSDGSDPSATIEIMDFGAAPHLVQGMTAWRSVPLNIENDDGYQRTGKFKEFPCITSYAKDGETHTMMILVADRYLVNIETNHVKEEDFKTFTESLPVEKLAKLK